MQRISLETCTATDWVLVWLNLSQSHPFLGAADLRHCKTACFRVKYLLQPSSGLRPAPPRRLSCQSSKWELDGNTWAPYKRTSVRIILIYLDRGFYLEFSSLWIEQVVSDRIRGQGGQASTVWGRLPELSRTSLALRNFSTLDDFGMSLVDLFHVWQFYGTWSNHVQSLISYHHFNSRIQPTTSS